MRDDFTAEEITELRQKHGVCKDKWDADRIKAIYLLGLKYSVVEVARVLMIDNAKYHFSKKVEAYLENSRIRLVPLPSYSPNLNLIERLWKFFKKKVLYNRYYKDLKEFRKACIHFFRNIDDVKDEMISFIGHEFELT
jgi:transposase